jgi:hypothetical protein
VFVLQYANANTIVGIIENLFRRRGDTQITVDSRTNRLIVSTSAEMMDEIQDLLIDLDVPPPGKSLSDAPFNLAFQVFAVETDYPSTDGIRFSMRVEILNGIDNLNIGNLNIDGVQITEFEVNHRDRRDDQKSLLCLISGHADSSEAIKSIYPFFQAHFGPVRVMQFTTSNRSSQMDAAYSSPISLPENLLPIVNKLLGTSSFKPKAKLSEFDLENAKIQLESAQVAFRSSGALLDQARNAENTAAARFNSGTTPKTEYDNAITTRIQRESDHEQAQLNLQAKEIAYAKMAREFEERNKEESSTKGENMVQVIGYWFGNTAVPGQCMAPIGPWDLEIQSERVPDSDFLLNISMREKDRIILRNTINAKIDRPIIVGYTRREEHAMIPGALIIIPQQDFMSDASVQVMDADAPTAARTDASSRARRR